MLLLLYMRRRNRHAVTAKEPRRPEAQFHASDDFDWKDLAARMEPIVRTAHEAKLAEVADALISSTVEQISRWEHHFQKHAEAPTPFFKERRSLLLEFPRLFASPLRVLEVGCGNGSSALAVLRNNERARVHATDPSSAAVEQTREAIAAAGHARRLSSEVQPSPTIPCSAQHGPFDAVMIMFTLSAIPGDDDLALLAASAALVRPGGAVLIRDYGLYDMRHRKDARAARLLRVDPPEYLRAGGMHRRYYSLERIGEMAAAVGLEVEESRYLCVKLRNERRQLDMERVYVHAVLTRRG